MRSVPTTQNLHGGHVNLLMPFAFPNTSRTGVRCKPLAQTSRANPLLGGRGGAPSDRGCCCSAAFLIAETVTDIPNFLFKFFAVLLIDNLISDLVNYMQFLRHQLNDKFRAE